MVWLRFSRKWLAPLVVLHDNITTQAYTDVLSTLLLPIVEEQFGGDDCICQHDRAHVHNAWLVAEWLYNNNIPVMDLPVQGPALNPLLHLWDVLDRRLHARPQPPISIPLLTTALRGERDAILQETSQHLIERMLARVEAVVKSKVGPTPY